MHVVARGSEGLDPGNFELWDWDFRSAHFFVPWFSVV